MSQEKFQQALSLFKAGDRIHAGELLLEIIQSDPGNADAWYGLATCTDSVEKKKYYLKKVLEINPQNTKVAKLLEKFDTENRTVSPSNNKEKILPLANIALFMVVGLMILCVAWLFYKVGRLEKSLTVAQSDVISTRNELAITKTKLANMQSGLNSTRSDLIDLQSNLISTRSTLASTISTLSYVKSVAENADHYAHSHNSFSDIRLKTNISEIKDPLNGILSLNGVTFLWNTAEYPGLGLNNDLQVGFIAQELEQVYPELVSSDENGYKTVDYVKLIPILVEALKEQQLMIINLQQHIENLEQSR